MPKLHTALYATPILLSRRTVLGGITALGASALGACTKKEEMPAMPAMPGMADAKPAANQHAGHAGMDMGSVPPLDRPPSTLVFPRQQPLRAMTPLRNQSTTPGTFKATLTAQAVQLSIAKDAEGKPVQTTFWAYNGLVPGPLIEVTEGDRVDIEVRNRLPVQETTIHWHGMPVPAEQDGNPMDPVLPGQSKRYQFQLPGDSAASYWYHPHPHYVTAEQVYRGLAGVFIVKPKRNPLPANLTEHVLAITDLRIDNDGSLPASQPIDAMNGRQGDFLLVNGQLQPVLTARPGQSVRLRLYNCCNARYLRLAVDKQQFTLIGTDGGLLTAPVPGQAELLLAPAERADVVLHLQGKAGDTLVLRNLNYERGWMGGQAPDSQAELLTIRLAGAATTPVQLPQVLRTIEALQNPKTTRQFAFGEQMSGGMDKQPMQVKFLINGKSFDASRVDFTMPQNQVELWEISNPTDMDHPFHVHGTQFQITERQTQGQAAIPAPYLSWKDTVNLAPNQTVRLLIRQDMKGLRMFHCHILEHEDNGMMGVLRVE